MPGPFPPSDDLVGPIIHAMALLVATQIPSVAHIYEQVPDRSPGDNTVIFQLTKGRVVDETGGKVRFQFTFSMTHVFRRTAIADNIARAYTYVMPWIRFLFAWPNQNLGGLAIEVNATDLSIMQLAESGHPMVALIVNFFVLTEFNIPTS
jgi:hypothetical protein